MTTFKDAIKQARAMGETGFPRSPTTQPEIQKQLRGLDLQIGAVEAVENLQQFLHRLQGQGAIGLKRFQLNRVLRGAWIDAAYDELGIGALDRAAAQTKRSSDQAIIEGYLTYFPKDRSVIQPLANAAERAASRHDWAWKRRSDEWSLFDPTRGPARVGSAVASAPADDASTLLDSIGIGPRIAATHFGRSVFIAACDLVAGMRSAQATNAQNAILAMFDANAQATDLPHLVRALLEPWVVESPTPEHRKSLSAFLVEQIGDPRSAPDRWKRIIASITLVVGADRASAIVQVLKRWLTDVAMREFFKAIAKTTDRPDQWRQRSIFWLAYLDASLVSDAWPALGQRARHGIEQIIRQSGERPEFGMLLGGPISSSTIIMQIGDLRIAEWSDNGSCRFWSDNDPAAPRLYAKTYDGGALRTTHGRADYEFHSHVPQSPGWEGKFAGIIHRRTGIAHPTLGRGRGRSWDDKW